jgi:murein DD-endopeptidase MepM/ murein hydrolase activator NlpD
MPRARIRCCLTLLALLGCLDVGLASAGAADTATDLDAARRRVAETQADANATAAEFSAAEGRQEELSARIDTLEAQIEATQRRVATLQEIVRKRALLAYTHPSYTGLAIVFESDNALEGARRAQLLNHANANDNAAIRELATLRSDLDDQQSELRDQRDEQARVKERLNAKIQTLQTQLAEAAQARDTLAARLEEEKAAAAAAAAQAREAAARLEREKAAAAAAAELARLRAAQSVPQPSAAQPVPQPSAAPSSARSSPVQAAPNPGSPAPIIPNPGAGAFQCPLGGSAYSNNYGPRGSGFHYGIDMFAQTGTPLVAVKAGSVNYVANEGAGGNVAYLAADDGNVYFYAHMSSFVGGARRVAQGEVIGLVGSTGNASGPHLHFEMRIGGVNGQRVNPYSTLRAAGC